MLGVAILPPPSAPPLYLKPTTSTNRFCFSLLEPSKARKKHLLFCPQLHHSLSSSSLPGRTGFCLFAQKKLKDSSFSRIELERQDFDVGFEIDDDGDEFNEVDEFDDDLYDDEEDLMVRYDKMDAWLKKKPKGFGEGKVYDTSLEDKLLEELEKSKKDQLANAEKLKNKAKEPMKELKKEVKVSEVGPGMVRVRINNLPKKMNIHRDLKSAFSGVHGIMNILPIVSGTKKTRDPICKGFAFVDFKSMEDAERFIQKFSGQNIAFGKAGKRIKCEILKSHDTTTEEPLQKEYNSNSGSEEEGVLIDDIEDVFESVSWEEDEDEFEEDDFEFEEDGDVFDEDSDDADDIGYHESSLMEQDNGEDGVKPRVLPSVSPLSTKPKEKKIGRKKTVGVIMPDNIKLNVFQPGYWEEGDGDDDDDTDDEDVIWDHKSPKLMVHKSSDGAETRSLRPLKKLSTKPEEKKMLKPVGKWKPDNSKLNVLQSESWEEEEDVEFDEDLTDFDVIVKHKSSSSRELHSNDVNPKEQQSRDSTLTKPKVKPKKAVKKKPEGKKKLEDSSKLKVPGSAKRLKVQDKAKLVDVYRRYGARQAVVSDEM